MTQNKQGIEHVQMNSTKVVQQKTTALLQNDQILEKLGQRIDRRLSIGYYCQVLSNRRSLIFPVRKKIPAKPKREHPIILKKKKKEKQVIMVDMQQNTDEVHLTDDFQNTSKQFILKEEDPILEDNEIQWSCEKTVIQQKNQSLQWSIEPIDQQVQYSLGEDYLQCRDASIQYDILQQVIQEKPQAVNRETQSVLIQQAQQSIQFDEVKPICKSQNIQIDIPDQQHIKNIHILEQKVKDLWKEQKRQIRINKKTKQQLQISSLKEDIIRLQSAVSLKQQKDKYLLKILEKQRQIEQNQKLHLSERNKIQDKIKKDYNNSLLQFISKSQISKNRERVNKQNKSAQKKQGKEIDQQKQVLLNYRKQASELTEQLKSQMLKRLKFEQDESNEQVVQNGNLVSNQNSDVRRGQLSYSSMQKLFPSVSYIKKCFAGSIVKNIPNPQQRQQKKLNSHFESAKLTKAYWREKSPFKYQFNNDHMSRSTKKSKFCLKINDKISAQELNNTQQKKNYTFSLNKIHSRNSFCLKKNVQKSKRYKLSKGIGNSSEFLVIKEKIDAFFENEMYFKFIYNQQNKINIGYTLFLIFGVSIEDKNNIQILRFPKHTVFTHFKDGMMNFIVISIIVKEVLYSKAWIQQKLPYKFYQSPASYKNYWVYEYLGPKSIYVGQYQQGKKHGFGFWYSGVNYFEGQFVEGYKKGKGKLSLQNGDIYEGQFDNNVFEGSGVYRWANGQVYDGYFEKGKKHGFGKQIYVNGDIYEGNFKQNNKQGNGVYKWKDGSCYQGEYEQDLKSGEGKLVMADGKCIFGQWKNDQLIKDWNEQRLRKKQKAQLPLLKRKR